MVLPAIGESAIPLLELAMVVIALAISASNSIPHMIRFYRIQAWVLALIVILTVIEAGQLVNLALALVPIFLAQAVRPLLGRASLGIPGAPSDGRAAGPPGRRRSPVELWLSLREAADRAEAVWLQHGKSRLGPGLSTGVDLILIVSAFVIAYLLTGSADRGIRPNDLAVSLALLLQGLFIMTNKRDIIAQVIGLLVAEHGLFLAAVSPVGVSPSGFVISLFFYLIVTLTILVWILPGLHDASGTIEVEAQRKLKG